MGTLLQIDDLDVRFATPEGEVSAVSDVSLDIRAGESVGVVGESGSGKTQLFLAVMGLLARNGLATGKVLFNGDNILNKPARSLNRIRGNLISMIFQDPMTSLNPYLKISRQMTELLVEHRGAGEAEARTRSIEMLDRVGIPEADQRFDMYPHEFSGGMRQRAMIAMALLCGPELLIADEPTTALDVTIQAQILELMRELREKLGTAMLLITHDMGVIAEHAERVVVMYTGKKVEEAPVDELFANPTHPYTRGLLSSIPRVGSSLEDERMRLAEIEGIVPSLYALGEGCSFARRCPHASDRCREAAPPLEEVGPGHVAACWHADHARAIPA